MVSTSLAKFRNVGYMRKQPMKRQENCTFLDNSQRPPLATNVILTCSFTSCCLNKLLEVTKLMGAPFKGLIQRSDMRLEANNMIANRGGTECFRRRHNADGKMEYDLVKVRKSGMQYPYRTPPLGNWTLGDCPFQDPLCAKGFSSRQKNAKIKRDLDLTPFPPDLCYQTSIRPNKTSLKHIYASQF
ncbi:hypothetical protein POM88_042423 [Heracleum sosnowskyi]|uniref:Uncharacterized protein n=1 Tax=Heracleum sosnowskyi TaxID=360622 RepID=A0AAD8HG66_9APIA|nr:hypothetical protein POM88_042423 [Heracleum sosnowskyi]